MDKNQIAILAHKMETKEDLLNLLNNIKHEIKWLQDVIAVYKGEAKAIFYYAGHGIPDEKDRAAYIFPVDGSPKEMQTCVSLKTVYERLASVTDNSDCDE